MIYKYKILKVIYLVSLKEVNKNGHYFLNKVNGELRKFYKKLINLCIRLCIRMIYVQILTI
jgi:hypothetical protein